MSALSYVTNGMSVVSAGSLATGGYLEPNPEKDLYRVSNTPGVKVHVRSFHERPPVLDTFTSVPSGNTTDLRFKGSYPIRSLTLKEALLFFPAFGSFFSRDRASIRHMSRGVQVYLLGRPQWNRVLTFDDWHRLEAFLSNPAFTALLGTLPLSMNPLFSVSQDDRDTLKSGIQSLYT